MIRTFWVITFINFFIFPWFINASDWVKFHAPHDEKKMKHQLHQAVLELLKTQKFVSSSEIEKQEQQFHYDKQLLEQSWEIKNQQFMKNQEDARKLFLEYKELETNKKFFQQQKQLLDEHQKVRDLILNEHPLEILMVGSMPLQGNRAQTKQLLLPHMGIEAVAHINNTEIQFLESVIQGQLVYERISSNLEGSFEVQDSFGLILDQIDQTTNTVFPIELVRFRIFPFSKRSTSLVSYQQPFQGEIFQLTPSNFQDYLADFGLLDNHEGRRFVEEQLASIALHNQETKAALKKELQQWEKKQIQLKTLQESFSNQIQLLEDKLKQASVSDLDTAKIWLQQKHNAYLTHAKRLVMWQQQSAKGELFQEDEADLIAKLAESTFNQLNPHIGDYTQTLLSLGDQLHQFNEKSYIFNRVAKFFKILYLAVINENGTTQYRVSIAYQLHLDPKIKQEVLVIQGVDFPFVWIAGPKNLSGFWMGNTEVTQTQWNAILGKRVTPFAFKGPQRPVEKVSWKTLTQVFLPKMNQLTKKKFRLPTENEWEFACQGGTAQFSYGTANGKLTPHLANYNKQSNPRKKQKGTMPVRQFPPNQFGLYDMSGNVWEWTADYYNQNKETIIIRGGSWESSSENVKCINKRRLHSELARSSIGFRLVIDQIVE